MERIVLVVVVVLGSLASAQDNETRLGELSLPKYNKHLHEVFMKRMEEYENVGYGPSVKQLTLMNEIINYTKKFRNAVALEFTWNLGNVTVQSIYESINGNCSTKIENLRVELKLTTCVNYLLWEMVMSRMKHAAQDGLEKMSRDCVQEWPTLCSTEQRHCTTAYEDSVRPLLRRYIQKDFSLYFDNSTTPLRLIAEIVVHTAILWKSCFVPINIFHSLESYLIGQHMEVPTEPFAFVNLIFPWINDMFTSKIYGKAGINWGVIASNTDSVITVSDEFNYASNMFRSHLDLISCNFKDPTERPLTWSSVDSIYFNSPCFCVMFSGDNCGVKVPEGVDPISYCFSVLFRDLQRQITYRPAVTYLDYAFKTRIPLCNFTNLLSLNSWSICERNGIHYSTALNSSVKCYFKDLVSKDLNCTETVIVNTYNNSVLCSLMTYVEVILCKDAARMSFSVSYYKAGNSTLVLSLTYFDVASRVLTLLSYLSCPQLRNLPGKLMMCYLTTAFMRLLVVNAILDDLEWAVRLDVAMDLASTLWLTAYLHFLTTSIKTLRLPNSLSRDEARHVLIRYSLFGWVLPAALSSAFLWMDLVLDSRIQFGQLFFVFCNYAALFANLYMFFYNCCFFYDVNSSISGLGLGVKPRNIFANLINFALKTSVLSGAGITIRLVLMQIQGLEHVLGYYHAVGTLQGLLLFLLYGCCREARVFWISHFRRIISRCSSRKVNSQRRNSMELVEMPVTEDLHNCSSS